MKSLGCVNEDENNNLINKLRFLLEIHDIDGCLTQIL